MATRSRYTGFGPNPFVGDMFQVRDGKIVDYWGVAQEVTGAIASGLGMF